MSERRIIKLALISRGWLHTWPGVIRHLLCPERPTALKILLFHLTFAYWDKCVLKSSKKRLPTTVSCRQLTVMYVRPAVAFMQLHAIYVPRPIFPDFYLSFSPSDRVTSTFNQQRWSDGKENWILRIRRRILKDRFASAAMNRTSTIEKRNVRYQISQRWDAVCLNLWHSSMCDITYSERECLSFHQSPYIGASEIVNK